MGKSSKDKRDAYYRLAKEQGWRARSAFKLLQLDEEFNLFENVHRVVDLCAAPGSWSQVLSRVLIRGERLGRATWEDKRYTCSSHGYGSQEQVRATQRESTLESPRNDVKIVAIDLQPMSPLDGITCLKADITHPSTIPLLLEALDSGEDSSSTAGDASRPVDLVLSDGAPDVTGLHDLDIYVQSQLLWAALNLALRVLRPGGKFVAKIFRGKDVDLLYAQLKVVFQTVTVAKPRSSRASSVEAFIVCVNFQPPPNFTGTLGCMLPVEQQPSSHECSSGTDIADGNSIDEKGIITVELQSTTLQSRNTGRDGWIAPFIACGDLSAYDSDASHRLPEGHVSLDPVQPPTAPPYRRALEERRKMGGAYGKTKLDVIKWR